MESPDATPVTNAVVVAHCADLVAEHYVLPEVGEQAAARLRERAAAGAYEGCGDPASLAAALTELGARTWQVEAVAGPLADAFVDAHQEPETQPAEPS